MHPAIEALKRAHEHWNAGDVDGYLQLYREDFVIHGLKNVARVRLSSGRELSFPGITILRFEGDKCVERWSQADFMSLLQDMGTFPQPN